MLAHQAHAKGVELTAWIDEQMPPVVRGDGGRLRQVVVNLVSNAVKFTEAGEVSVRAGATPLDGGDLLLDVAVTDSGIGIAPDRLPDAVRRVLAGGQLDHAPLRRLRARPRDLAPARRDDGRRADRHVAARRGQHVPLHRARSQASTAARPTRRPRASFPEGLRVLVVDDSRTNREIVRGYLDPRVTRCEQAETAQDALLLLHAAASAGEPYELVVLDLHMPGMDGLELAQAIRKAPSLRAARLIVLTSTTDAPGGRARGADRRLPHQAGAPRRACSRRWRTCSRRGEPAPPPIEREPRPLAPRPPRRRGGGSSSRRTTRSTSS